MLVLDPRMATEVALITGYNKLEHYQLAMVVADPYIITEAVAVIADHYYHAQEKQINVVLVEKTKVNRNPDEAAQLSDHYHARSVAHAHFLATHYYHKGLFRITSQRSHIIADLLVDLGESGSDRNRRRRNVRMKSMCPQVLPILAAEDVVVFRSVRRTIRNRITACHFTITLWWRHWFP